MMSNVPASGRSFATIERTDLNRLAAIAVADRLDRFDRHPRWRQLYEHGIVTVALCQGAALHMAVGNVGIQDFDVWTFYADHPEGSFPPRWMVARDFGDSKFGQSPDRPGFVGR